MVIIKMWAGLGNQMFLYALYKAFLAQGKEAKIDTSYYDFYSHIQYELPRIFSLDIHYATLEESLALANTRQDLFNRFIRKYIYQKKTHYVQDVTREIGYNDAILKMEHVYLQGYFQSEKFFEKVRENVRRDFRFIPSLDSLNQKLAQQIHESQSVSIHVRRGDYLPLAKRKEKRLFGVCDLDYYKRAISCIKERVQDPVFFVFSDDIVCCREVFHDLDAQYIDHNHQESSYKDMQLMSLCKHNIIANSTFSWWGAWLNDHSEKIVIAPRRWQARTENDGEDIIPAGWVKL